VRPDHGKRVPTVIDYKVKSTPVTERKARSDFQPSVCTSLAVGARTWPASSASPRLQARASAQGDERHGRHDAPIELPIARTRWHGSPSSPRRSSPATSVLWAFRSCPVWKVFLFRRGS